MEGFDESKQRHSWIVATGTKHQKEHFPDGQGFEYSTMNFKI
ncbi:unnamed protein product [Nezara viridula]|uniref:Uncharacterized protein n=1 Tax=Nezara viridula TaxID=85310 RepID=A0A9P0E0B4_NEZVI|nr:unnamed protein product [Nezara viridula]